MTKRIAYLAITSILLQMSTILLILQKIEESWIMILLIFIFLFVAIPAALHSALTDKNKAHKRHNILNFIGIVLILPSIFGFTFILTSIDFSSSIETSPNVGDPPKSNKTVNTDYVEYKTEKSTWKFYFPQTVYVNESNNGKIIYNGILDTITTSFDDKKKSRYFWLIMTANQQPNIDRKSLNKIDKDTFGAVDFRTIPINNIKFSKLGKYYIHGIINDHVIIDTFSRPTTDKDLLRYIENEFQFQYEVTVVPRPKKTT